MSPSQTHDHADHLRFEQEHLQWNADHLKSLAMLRRVEAHLYAHEAEIGEASLSHEVAPAPGEAGAHQAMAHQHTEAGRNHQRLADAIQALGGLI